MSRELNHDMWLWRSSGQETVLLCRQPEHNSLEMLDSRLLLVPWSGTRTRRCGQCWLKWSHVPRAAKRTNNRMKQQLLVKGLCPAGTWLSSILFARVDFS